MTSQRPQYMVTQSKMAFQKDRSEQKGIIGSYQEFMSKEVLKPENQKTVIRWEKTMKLKIEQAVDDHFKFRARHTDMVHRQDVYEFFRNPFSPSQRA